MSLLVVQNLCSTLRPAVTTLNGLPPDVQLLVLRPFDVWCKEKDKEVGENHVVKCVCEHGKRIKLEAINTQQLLFYQLLIYIVHKMVTTFWTYINIGFHVSIRSYQFLMCFMANEAKTQHKHKHTHTDHNNNRKQNMLMTLYTCVHTYSCGIWFPKFTLSILFLSHHPMCVLQMKRPPHILLAHLQ